MNTYGYVEGNPIVFFDSDGLLISGRNKTKKSCKKVKIWVCDRPIYDPLYGVILPNHKYVCCGGSNKNCFGHRRNNLEKGDPIPTEPYPTGNCQEIAVCEDVKDKKCNNPKSPCDASTLGWNCGDWAEWNGSSSCPIWAK